MLAELGKLFGIFFLVILGIFLAGLSLRVIGQNQQFASFSHPLREVPPPVIFQPAGTNENFFSFTVRPDREGIWYIADYETDLTKAPRFFEFVDKHPDAFIYADILHPGAPVVHLFFDELLKRSNLKRFLIQSNFHDTIRIARERSVEILTGTSVSELGRMLLFTNLYLEPLVDPGGEFVVLEAQNDRLMTELFRRFKFVFIRDASPASRSQISSAFPQVGFLTTRDNK